MIGHAAQKMKFSTKDFFSKCVQILRKLQILSHLLKKSLMKNFIFCEVSCSFHLILVTHLKPSAGGKEPKNFEFSKIILPFYLFFIQVSS